MRPPSRWLAPGARTAVPPPPPAIRRRRQGTRGPPPLPPPLPLRPMSGRRQTEETAPPHPPRRGRCTRGAGAPRPRQAPARPPRCRPTADRRRPGWRKRSSPIRDRPGEDGGANQGGGIPPPFPSPPPPHWPVGGRPDRARRPRSPGNPHGTSIPRGGTPETMDGRPTPDGARGRGGGPPIPPPAPPPSLGATGAALRPPRAEGTPPPPGREPRRGGRGMRLDLHIARPSAPSRLLPRESRPQGEPTSACGATRAPTLGAAHGGAPEQDGGRALHDPPVTAAHSGRAEGGFRSAGAPGGAVHGPPRTPPHPGAAPRPRSHAHAGRECADDTKGARTEYRRPPPRRGAGRPRRDPLPPHPPHRPASRGGPSPRPPRQGGWSPPRPREEPERDPPPRPSRRLPQGPRRTSKPAPTRQDAAQIAPREGGRARTGVVWGATPPMDSATPVTPALLPAQGRQRDGTRQSDPPPYRPPPGRTNGGYGARSPPPPARPPAHERHGPAPRRADSTGRAGRGDRDGLRHPHARAHNTWIADPNSLPSGRAVGGGGAPDPRSPSQQ